MILKSLSRRSKSFAKLIDYILQYQSLEARKEDSFVITQHLKGKSKEAWTKEFIRNEHERLHYRASPVTMYHTIISFHSRSYGSITKNMLVDITRKYLQLRGDGILAMASAHMDKKNVHIHLIEGSVDVFFHRSCRMNKSFFQNIKLELQKYYLDKFPMLVHSRIDHGKSKSKKISENEFHLKKAGKQTVEKEVILNTINYEFEQAQSKQEFYKILKNKGIEVYERYGKPYGVIGSRKYRFSTLGFDKELNILDKMNEFQEMNSKQFERNHSR